MAIPLKPISLVRATWLFPAPATIPNQGHLMANIGLARPCEVHAIKEATGRTKPMTDLISRRQFSGLLTAGAAASLAPFTAGAAPKPAMSGGRKVIFDTDPGIDDAMALL